jgi:uncharacterized protein (TIGR02246 family)
MSIEDRVAALENELGRLQDIRAIEQLKYRYAGYCDNGYDPDGIASLFLEDGVWVVNGVGGDVAGRDAIRSHFRELSKTISWALHFMMAPHVELSSDRKTAVGKFYLLCLCTIAKTDAPAENDAVVLTLNYVDQFVKVGEQWLFKELRGTMHQASSWELGWVKQQWRP